MSGLTALLGRIFSTPSWPFPIGSQNRDGIECNRDNPLHSARFNEDLVLRLSAAWACVRLISQTISTLPFNVYRNKPGGGRELDSTFWLYGLLHNSPNSEMTAQTFWEAYVASLLLYGNAYGEKKPVGGQVAVINFLVPARVRPRKLQSGAWEFEYNDPINGMRVITEANMFHTLGFTLDGCTGVSPIAYGSSVFTSALHADTAANMTFTKGLMPTVAFSMEQVLKENQRDEFRENFQKISGAFNAGKTVLLEGGMKAQAIGIDPVDAQLLESRAWSVEEICRWFGVPPFMVGHAEKSTSWGTGIEQQMIGFLTFCLRPWLSRIEQSVKKNLLRPGEEQNTITVEFAVEGLLRADSAARAAYLSTMVQNGLMTRDEARAYDNRAPVGGAAAQLTVQSNLLPIDRLGQNTQTVAKNAILDWLGLGASDDHRTE